MHWGHPPYQIDFAPPLHSVPAATDFAVIGGGFTGLAAAAWLRLLAPGESVVLLEASRLGAGASGRTGGIVLAETAAGDLPGLGDVLAGFTDTLSKLEVECELHLPGAWEIGRRGYLERSPISWNDSGTLRVVREVPGGTLDPGKLVAGLARAAERREALLLENQPVARMDWGERPELQLPGGRLRAAKILFATNALSLDLAGLAGRAEPRLTLAAATEPLGEQQLEALGLSERKPFYTVDLPYLWGRVRGDRSIVWGAGLVNAPDARDLESVDIFAEEPARLFASLESRVRRLHPSLQAVRFTHRWGGPVLFRDNWQPVFDRHPQSRDALLLGAYAGHGVALSVYLGRWAAEALLGRRDLPPWGRIFP